MINNNASYQFVRRLPRLGLVLASAAAVAMLGACSDNTGTTTPGAPGAGSSSSAPVGQFNDADVMFAQMMIPHHQQAVEMSDIVLAKPGVSAEVRELAQQIKDAQQPEIDQMTGWLQQWGQPTEMPGGGMDHGGMDHGGGEDGMLSETELQELRDAPDADAQRLFLEGMIAHHEGAVAMAETEIADGQNADAKALAQEIVTSQQAEIETMRGLLAG